MITPIVVGAENEIMQPVEMLPNELRSALQDIHDAPRIICDRHKSQSFNWDFVARRIGEHIAWIEEQRCNDVKKCALLLQAKIVRAMNE